MTAAAPLPTDVLSASAHMPAPPSDGPTAGPTAAGQDGTTTNPGLTTTNPGVRKEADKSFRDFVDVWVDYNRGIGVNPMDPQQAIDGAAKILSGDIAKFGSVPLALAAYNAGAGAVEQYGGIPPYPETQAYVNKIMNLVGGTTT